jgi:hypothetical protein
MKTKISMISLLIAGCSDHWTKIGQTDEPPNIDLFRCKQENLFRCKQENRNARDGSVRDSNRKFAQEELVKQCMRAGGTGSK